VIVNKFFALFSRRFFARDIRVYENFSRYVFPTNGSLNSRNSCEKNKGKRMSGEEQAKKAPKSVQKRVQYKKLEKNHEK